MPMKYDFLNDYLEKLCIFQASNSGTLVPRLGRLGDIRLDVLEIPVDMYFRPGVMVVFQSALHAAVIEETILESLEFYIQGQDRSLAHGAHRAHVQHESAGTLAGSANNPEHL